MDTFRHRLYSYSLILRERISTNGVHDMGGMHGFGPVQAEEDEPVFHSPWEARVFGMAMALGPQGTYPWEDFRIRLIP